jgi:hypothetical protein
LAGVTEQIYVSPNWLGYVYDVAGAFTVPEETTVPCVESTIVT